MAFPVYLPFNYQSQYSLLGSMARELAAAFAVRGCAVNPPGVIGERPALYLFFNAPADLADLPAAALRPGSNIALAQFHVDHPFALNPRVTDALAELPNFRMFLPCVDSAHLLRLRWPRLAHAHCAHGVPPSALCDASTINSRHDARHLDLLIAGSIHTELELERKRERIPAPLRRAADDIVELLAPRPSMPFEQAMDVVLAPNQTPAGQWALAAMLWEYAVAAVNRRRRVALVRAMQGVRTVVLGGAAWAEFCTGTIEHRADVPYNELPGALASARVCLAWGPTQFAHSFSERLLLALAAGCATVADDRLMIRREFASAGVGACVSLFDAHGPESPMRCRAAVDELLNNAGRRHAMASAGRAIVERAHLWHHRTDLLASISSAAIAA